jgi:hypothetical protein
MWGFFINCNLINMAITLPNAATANTESTTANSDAVAVAQADFISTVTVLINNATANGLFMVQPFLPALVTSTYVTTYFAALGYTVQFPIIPPFPGNPCFVPEFPEVLPPGYVPWNCGCNPPGPPRIQISWGP